MKRSIFFATALFFMVNAFAQMPAGFTKTIVANGLTDASAVQETPDGRLFVLEEDGTVNVVKNGSLLSTPFIKLNVDNNGERGLLGIAFDPNFISNQYVYLYYTQNSTTGTGLRNKIIRVTANGDLALAGSEQTIFELDNVSTSTIHNGGAMLFGNDGKLYVAVGDNDNPTNAQNMSSLMGKILRIESNGTIPIDNPFYNTATGNNRAIYALGLRHPLSMSLQATTGLIYANDIGDFSWEEIDDIQAGRNYGWPIIEGFLTNQTPPIDYLDPLYAYDHSNGQCGIIGAAFYNPTTTVFPNKYVGKYFFGDYCANYIKVFDPSTNTLIETLDSNAASLIALKVTKDGYLYYLTKTALWKITYTATIAPTITQDPSGLAVAQGSSASFSITATGSATLTYQWQVNQVNIQAATTNTYTINTTTAANNNTKYRCIVKNSAGSDTSLEATLTVSPLTIAPTITQDPSNLTVAQGSSASFSITATGSATLTYQWQVNQANIQGATGNTYTINSTTAANNNTKYRCIVTNSAGSATSLEAILTVIINQPPVITLIQPAANATYGGGTTIAFSATATDPQDGVLPASAFTWQIDFYHATHIHPALPATSGIVSGGYDVPTIGETSDTVFYRVQLTVTDSKGLTTTTFVDVLPLKSTLSFTTDPAGNNLVLEGQRIATPFNVLSVQGIQRTIEAPTTINSGSSNYIFSAWEDGTTTNPRSIITPTQNAAYKAIYVNSTGPLPFRLDYFRGYVLDGYIGLNWQIDQPSPGVIFEVEKSKDGISFYKIGTVTQPSSGTTLYSFIDTLPLVNNYYRLTIIDKYNRLGYSNILLVKYVKTNNQIIILPNPVSTSIEVRFPFSGNMQCTVYNLQGSVLLNMIGDGQAINQQINNLMGRWADGTYFVSAIQNSKLFAGKFIKIRGN
jgi:glucose/arabinose dehydrogenase